MTTRKNYLRPLDFKQGRVDMTHGAGGRAAAQLIEELFATAFDNEFLRQGQQAVAQAGNMLMREAVQKLDRAAQDAERERHQLAGLIGTVRKQDEQRNWLLWTGLGALVVGLLASPFVAGVLPFGGDSVVAALIMKADRWNAGIALMQAGSPDGWRGVAAASDLVRVNQEVLTACREAAAKTKKEQRCTITVPAQ